jgi:hypothetical protein
MEPHVCVCCGEPVSKSGNATSRHSGFCPSCSSLLDGMEIPSEKAAVRAGPAILYAAPAVFDIQFAQPEGHLCWGINE